MMKSRLKRNLIQLAFIFAVALLNQPRLNTDWEKTIRGLTVSFAFIGFTIFWGYSVLNCIKEKKSRMIMIQIIVQLVLWMLLRCIKYEVWDPDFDIALWYLFYVPQTLLPLLGFYMTFFIDTSKSPRWSWLLLIPAGLIIIGILTNNYNQLAFKFKDDIIDQSGAYTYGPLFYISIAWMMVMMLATIINATRKSRLLNNRKATVILSVWLFVPILYLLYTQFGPFIGRTVLFNFPEGSCLLHMIFLEICIQSGLFVTNRSYADVFENASIMAEITDEEGCTYRKTKMSFPLTTEEKKESQKENIIVNGGYELSSVKIRGGYVYWQNDVSQMIRLNHELQDVKEQLSQEYQILKAEIDATEKRASLEEQNRIYDSIAEALSEQSEMVLKLLEDKANLNKVLILAAYMKRKSNLLIMARQQDKLDIRELGLAVNESLSYLALEGCVSSCVVDGSGYMSSEKMIEVYDGLDQILRSCYSGLQAIICYIKMGKDGLRIRFELEVEEGSDKELKVPKGFVMEKQEDTIYYTCSCHPLLVDSDQF